MTYKSSDQLNGTAAHRAVDESKYSTRADVMMGTDVYCEKYNLIGKIDIYDITKGILRERKKKIVQIYDGYIFQVYAQYFALIEMGYKINKIELYSIDDHRTYDILLPDRNTDMLRKFEKIIIALNNFRLDGFKQSNPAKCKRCIYEPACDRSLI